MLSQGNCQETIHFALNVFSTNSRELEASEFDNFMKAFLSILIKENQNELDITFIQDLRRFWKKMMNIKQKNSSTRFDELKKEILTDAFTRYCQTKGIFVEGAEDLSERLSIQGRKFSDSPNSRFSPAARHTTKDRSNTMYLQSIRSPKPTVRFSETAKYNDRRISFGAEAYDVLSGLDLTEVSSQRTSSPDFQDNQENKDCNVEHQEPSTRRKSSDISSVADVRIKLQDDEEIQDPKADSATLKSSSSRAAFSSGKKFILPQTDLDVGNHSKPARRSQFFVPILNDDDNLLDEPDADCDIAEPMKPDHELVYVVHAAENRRSAHSVVLQGIDRSLSVINTEMSFVEAKGSIQIFQSQMREVQVGCSTRICAKIEPDRPSETSRPATENPVSRNAISPRTKKDTLKLQTKNIYESISEYEVDIKEDHARSCAIF